MLKCLAIGCQHPKTQVLLRGPPASLPSPRTHGVLTQKVLYWGMRHSWNAQYGTVTGRVLLAVKTHSGLESLITTENPSLSSPDLCHTERYSYSLV